MPKVPNNYLNIIPNEFWPIFNFICIYTQFYLHIYSILFPYILNFIWTYTQFYLHIYSILFANILNFTVWYCSTSRWLKWRDSYLVRPKLVFWGDACHDLWEVQQNISLKSVLVYREFKATENHPAVLCTISIVVSVYECCSVWEVGGG